MSDAIDPEACPCYVRGLRGEDGDHAIDCVVGPLEAKLEAAERNAKYTDAYVVAASIEVPNLRERLEAAERERDELQDIARELHDALVQSKKLLTTGREMARANDKEYRFTRAAFESLQQSRAAIARYDKSKEG